MAEDIKNIAITDALTVHKPSRHIAYTIQVATATRSWSVNRRYNDFVALDTELRSSTGKQPPATLPPKHWFKRTMNDEEKIRQRRVQLEIYLRTILTTKDARWRSEYGYTDFLGVPTGRAAAHQPPDTLTPALWLGEHSAVSSELRDARAALLKRDALARVGDSKARAAGGEARKSLRDAGPRIDNLEKVLSSQGSSLGDGEKRRRDDLVAGLRSEHSNLLRTAEAGFRPQRTSTPPPEAGGIVPGAMPSNGSSLFAPAPSGRVFGKKAAPQETAETRPLDDRGLVQLQQQQMAQQDDQLGVLSGLLRRQHRMGEEIHAEVAAQNEMLEHIDGEVTRVGGKLARTKRQMNRLG